MGMKVVVIVSLQDLISELGEGEATTAVQTRDHTISIQHRIHANISTFLKNKHFAYLPISLKNVVIPISLYHSKLFTMRTFLESSPKRAKSSVIPFVFLAIVS